MCPLFIRRRPLHTKYFCVADSKTAFMKTLWHGNAFRITKPVCGPPVTKKQLCGPLIITFHSLNTLLNKRCVVRRESGIRSSSYHCPPHVKKYGHEARSVVDWCSLVLLAYTNIFLRYFPDTLGRCKHFQSSVDWESFGFYHNFTDICSPWSKWQWVIISSGHYLNQWWPSSITPYHFADTVSMMMLMQYSIY